MQEAKFANVKQFTTYCPLTGSLRATHQFIDRVVVESSIEDLYKSFLKWKILNTKDRQNILSALATKLENKKENFAELITLEMGKPISQSRREVEKSISALKYLCETDFSFLNKEVYTFSEKASNEVIHEALGVILGVMPWNYPLWQAIRMMIPALISGNTVLLKHSEVTPLIGAQIAELFEGIWSEPLLSHRIFSHEITENIIGNYKIGGVSLTGSVEAGLLIQALSAKYLKKTVLELGGSDPYIILPDADFEAAAKVTTQSRFLNTGQTCISAKRCLIPENQIEKCIDLFDYEYKSYSFGDPNVHTTQLGPLAQPRYKSNYLSLREKFLNDTNAEVVINHRHLQNDQSSFVDAEVCLLKKNTSWLKDKEFFGPLLVLIPYKEVSEAIAIANSTNYALGAAVFSQNKETAHNVASCLQAGMVSINKLVSSDYRLPFGGFKYSGIGRELGKQGLFEFTQTKVISI